MLLSGEQINALADFADGDDCRVTKLAGTNSAWAQVVRHGDNVTCWIDPVGQILDFHPAKPHKAGKVRTR